MVTIYWFNGNVESSMRFYKEFVLSDTAKAFMRYIIVLYFHFYTKEAFITYGWRGEGGNFF